MGHPFFSVIIPTYNSSRTLQECLRSFINQSIRDFEILIIDGGSSDETISVVQNCIGLASQVRWTSERDNGVYDAMNKGIKKAKGEWLYFLGSDDSLYSNDVLEKVADFIRGKDVQVVYGNVFTRISRKIYDGEFTKEKLFNNNICHQSIFIHRSVFEITGLFSMKYKIFSDWHHNIKWFYNKDIKHAYLDAVIANYAEDGLSSHNVDLPFMNDRLGLFLKYGHAVLRVNTAIHIAELAATEKKEKRETAKYLCFRLQAIILKIKRKLGVR